MAYVKCKKLQAKREYRSRFEMSPGTYRDFLVRYGVPYYNGKNAKIQQKYTEHKIAWEQLIEETA